MESIIVCSDEDRGWPEIVKEFTKNSIDFRAVYTSVDSELHFNTYHLFQSR